MSESRPGRVARQANVREDRDHLDPVSLEILWSRLIAISEEQAAMVLRTAFSSIVRGIGTTSPASC